MSSVDSAKVKRDISEVKLLKQSNECEKSKKYI